MLENYAKKRFMIVDELDSFRFSTKKALMSLGAKLIDTATSAQQVVSAFQNVNYDVILCNYDLGKGKNGQELLEELRFKHLLNYNALFFIISAEVAKSKVLGTIENEPDGYFVKPVTPADLGKRLSKALELKDATRQIDQALDKQDFTKAITLCDDAIEGGTPYKLICLKIKSWSLTKLERTQEARALYETLLSKSDYVWAEFGLANILIQDKEYEAAEKLLRHIIEKDDNRVEAYDLLAEIATLKKNPAEAKHYLKQAASRSPNSLLRQKALADAALQSGSTEEGFDAFRKVVKLSDQSIYANSQHFFHFADALSKVAGQDDSSKNKLSKEASELLQKARKRFADEPQIIEQAQFAEVGMLTNLGEKEKAEALLQAVNTKLSEKGETLLPESAILAAKAMFDLDLGEEAEKVLEAAADKAEKNSDTLQQMYDLMEGKISLQQRQEAAEKNKQGITLYNEGKLEEAIKTLLGATLLTPRHISLNLNLLQVILKQSKVSGLSQHLNTCEMCLHKVRNIPTTHKEYKRYNFLKNQFEKIRHESA